MRPETFEYKECPFCGSPAYHESTITEEVVRCTLCKACMTYDGSESVINAMWNGRWNSKEGKIEQPTTEQVQN